MSAQHTPRPNGGCIERRLHPDDITAREFLDAERVRQWEAMRDTLNRAEHKALNRRFAAEPAAVSAFGSFA